MKRRWVTALQAAALVIASVLVTLVGVEIALRARIPPSTADLFEFTTETRRYRVMKKNHEGLVYGVPFRTNARGYRDHRDHIPPQRPGELRVVVLGDSYTVAAGVPYEDLFTRRLEARLRAALPGSEVSVFNLGVGGMNLQHYYYILLEDGLPLDPDAIVLALFVSNDFLSRAYEEYRALARGDSWPVRERWLMRFYTVRAFGHRVLDLWKAARASLGRRGPPPRRTPDLEAGWNDTSRALGRIVEIAAHREIPLLLVLLPGNWTWETQRERHGWLMQYCARRGYDCVDLLEDFAATGRPPEAFRLNLIDVHPNAAYNGVVAEALVREIGARAWR